MEILAIAILATTFAATIVVLLGKPIKIEYHKTIVVKNQDTYTGLTDKERAKLVEDAQEKFDKDKDNKDTAKSLEGIIANINQVFGVPTGPDATKQKGE